MSIMISASVRPGLFSVIPVQVRTSKPRSITSSPRALEAELQVLQTSVEQVDQQVQLVSFNPAMSMTPAAPMSPPVAAPQLLQHGFTHNLLTPEHVIVQWTQAPHMFTALNEGVYDYLALSSIPILIYVFLKGTVFPFFEKYDEYNDNTELLPNLTSMLKNKLPQYGNRNNKVEKFLKNNGFLDALAIISTKRIISYVHNVRKFCRSELKLRHFNNDHIGSHEWDAVRAQLASQLVLEDAVSPQPQNGCQISVKTLQGSIGFPTWKEIRDVEDEAICECLISMAAQQIILREMRLLFDSIDEYYNFV
eukprot:TRINITY_DN15488_c1_g1_i4.p1 TRINITY_DN15488_c1_g1~~TRINITY_DN15488_c1_g1_i4.p1  ORF type:complete len:337 (+),score=27.30 TRINITY_DN15488_c1_g1_i4:93-1013(+)